MLESNISKTPRWDVETYRFDSLTASFEHSIRLLPHEVKLALGNLSFFKDNFWENFAIPLLVDNPSNLITEEGDSQNFALWRDAEEKYLPILEVLWSRGLLERTVIRFEDKNLTFYKMHSALRPFARQQITVERQNIAMDGYFRVLRLLMRHAYPLGILANPVIALISKQSLFDLIEFAKIRNDIDGLNMQFKSAFILAQFGKLDDALNIYQHILNELDRFDIGKG